MYVDTIETVDELLEIECYIIDWLPETVSKNAATQFLDVEYYLLNSKRHSILKDKFISIILKIMCYYHISILWNGWIDWPKPEMIENAISEIIINHSGTLDCLFPEEHALLVFNWDCLNLSVYNPSETMQRFFKQIAFSEGLFWRVAE